MLSVQSITSSISLGTAYLLFQWRKNEASKQGSYHASLALLCCRSVYFVIYAQHNTAPSHKCLSCVTAPGHTNWNAIKILWRPNIKYQESSMAPKLSLIALAMLVQKKKQRMYMVGLMCGDYIGQRPSMSFFKNLINLFICFVSLNMSLQ